MNTAYLRYVTKNPNANIEVTASPFPLTANFEKLKKTTSGFIAAFMFSIGLSFIPASLITFIVKERNDNVKHQQIVSGVSLFSYWLSNYVVDMLKHMVPAVFGFLMVLAFDITVY